MTSFLVNSSVSLHTETVMSNDQYVIEPPAISTLPVAGNKRMFPINRVFCIGRNYAAHAVDMGYDSDKEPPFFFLKSACSVTVGEDFPHTEKTADLHHEVEMVVALGKGGIDISVDAAHDHVFGYGIGLDITRRDLQGEANKMGRP